MNYPNTFWENRYQSDGYTYGTRPNAYFKAQLDAAGTPGRLLLLAEGEGRNAVYAAAKGWQVTAVDFSPKAREKALALAEAQGVEFEYLIADIQHFDFDSHGKWDAVALIYAHFPAAWRASVHRKCADALAPGGILVVEAFNPNQLSRTSGGPKNIDMLYSKTILEQDFEPLETIECKELTIVLDEGEGHSGFGEVVRGYFRKK